MKVLVAFLCQVLLIQIDCKLIARKAGEAVDVTVAISKLVSETRETEVNIITLFNEGECSATPTELLVDSIVRLLSAEKLCRCISLKENQKFSAERNQLSVIILESFDSFRSFIDFLRSEKPVSGKFLIHYPKAKRHEIDKLGKQKSIGSNFYVLVEDDDGIELVSFEYFSPGICKQLHTKTINHFSKAMQKWKHQTFAATRRDFFGCDIVFGFIPTITSHFHVKNDIAGHVVDLLQTASKRFNFNFKYEWCHELKKCSGRVDLDVNLNSITSSAAIGDNANYTASEPYAVEEWTFIVPLGKPYTTREKMFLPISYEVWLSLMASTLIGIVAIELASSFAHATKRLIFGRNVRTPDLNLFINFFGYGCVKLPGSRFTKFLLMMSLIECLMIRSLHQGEFYRFLKCDMRRPGAQTIQEVIDGNYTLYVTEAFENLRDVKLFAKYLSETNFFRQN